MVLVQRLSALFAGRHAGKVNGKTKARNELLRALGFSVLDWVLIRFSSSDSVDSGTSAPHLDVLGSLVKNKPASETQ
jgi:hypothetical protein